MPTPTTTAEVNLYRDIHKGLRGALFHAVLEAGRLDSRDDDAVQHLVGTVREAMQLLASHHRHEDQPPLADLIATHAPELVDQIDAEHQRLALVIEHLPVLADEVAASAGEERASAASRLYLELAAFTAAYLAHLDVEERRVMPALAARCSTDELLTVQAAILSAIPLDEKARGFRFMMPAISVDDRAALLGPVKLFAPPPVFEQLRGVTQAALTPAEYAQVAGRLGIA